MNLRAFIYAIVALIGVAIPSPAPALTIMPMGDSITTGIDFLTNSHGGYRDPLQTTLVSSAISFNFMGVSTNNSTAALTASGNQYHNGYSGWKISDLQNNLNGNLQANPGDPNFGGYWITGGNGTGRTAQLPDILLLHVGGNDILQNYDPQTASPNDAQFIADMGQRLTNLVTAFHTLSPNTVIMVASIIPVNTGSTPMARAQGYNNYIKNTLVPSLSYTRFVDQYAGFVNADGSVKTELLGTDNVHPTGSGYQTMALKWKPAIQAYIAGGGSAPSAPTGLGATAGNAQVSLSWTAGSGATSYNVYRGTSAGGESATPIATGITATAYTNTGLVNGTVYYYKIAAINASGTSGYSNEASATPTAGGSAPAAPTGLGATAGNTQIGLNWTAASGATSYNIYRGTSAGGESTTAIVTGITTTTYTNTGLANGTAYYYKVAAVNSFGTSGYSNEASATPVSGGGGSVTVANNSFETPSTGNYIANPAGANWTFTNNAGIQHNGSAYSASAAPDGVQTGFIQGFGSLGTMSQSISFAAAGSYSITFQAAMRYGVAQPLLISVDGTAVGTYSPASNSFAPITTASFTVTAGSHTIMFAATDSSGDKTTFVDAISISGGGGGSAPAAPTGLGATAGNAQVNLSWTASSGATSYNVYRGTTAGGESTTAIATGVTGITYTNTGLSNGTAYYYKVAAVNSFGTSTYSNEASATPAAGGSAPAAPTGLGTTAGNAQVSLSWTASSGAATYNIYRGTSAGGESTTPIATGITPTTYTNTGLSNGTTYYYKVAAVNSFGTSGYSNEASSTPIAGGGGGSAAFANNSFEAPFIGGYFYNPSGSSWTFTNNGGIQHNGSAYSGTATVAPDGVQTAFLQGSGTLSSMSQSVSFSAAGSYTISFQAAGRYGSIQPLVVSIDGTSIGTYAPISDSFALITTASFTVTAGSHTIMFAATDSSGDKTTFLDAMSINVGGGGSAPAAPTGLGSSAGNTQVSLSWTASSSATSYNVYRGTSAGAENTTPIVTGLTGTSYTNTGLSNGTAYYYKVAAVNATGTSGYSNEASATPAAGGSAPAAPTGLAATPGNTQVSLSWAATSGATSYNVYRGTSAGAESTTPVATGITATTYINNGLSNGTVYYYKIAAVNSFGTSGYSNEASATPATGGGGSATFANASFETPSISGYSYTPAGSSWTFTNNGGIQHNGSAYSGSATIAPDGVQTAFLQGSGSLSTMTQTVSFSAAGNYKISFQAAQRWSTVQPVLVSINGTAVGTYSPASNSFALLTTAVFAISAPGNYTISFAATDSTADKSTFIDSVSISTSP